MASLKGKAALITGAAHPQGIGRSIAEHLGREGARILIGDIDRTYMDQAVRDMEKLGIQASCYDLDVSDANEVQTAIDRMIEDVGGIDILVNNVGGSSRISRKEMQEQEKKKSKSKTWHKGPVIGISNAGLEQWHQIINVNLHSVFYCSRAVLPYMKERRHGKIVNLASIVGQRGIDKVESFTSGPYAVAKAAVIGLTRQLSLETAEYGINVNAVAPAYVRSAKAENFDFLPKEQYEALLETIPWGRLAEPNEIAGVVLGLCTDQFAYVTGQTINVNGGMYFG